MSKIIKELTYPQGEMFLMRQNRVPFALFTGGYGCGKSEILVENAIRDIKLFYGCKVACYAPTLDLLSLNVIPRIEVALDKLGIKHKYNSQKKIMFLPGDRQFIFRSMHDEGRIVAYEVYASHIDEADLMHTVAKADAVFNRIIARNRQLWLKKKKPYKKNGGPNLHKNHFNQVCLYSTPEGFKWTYQRFKKNPGEGYKYVQAPTSSNWNLDKTFIKNLRDTYTPAQCEAYLEGKWTNIFTGSVYTYFDRKKHHTDKVILKGDKLIVGCDFNYGGNCVSIYKAITEWSKATQKQRKEIPSKRAIYELQQNIIGLSMVSEITAHDTEQMIIELKSKFSKQSLTLFPDATGDKNNSNASQSDIAMLKQAGFPIKAHSINPRILDRVNAVQRLMYQNKFEINTHTCPKSTEAFEEHAYSETTGLPEKFAGSATVDDRNDSSGYPIAYLFPIRKLTTTRMDI